MGRSACADAICNYIKFVVRDQFASMPPTVALPNVDRRSTRKPFSENVFWLFRPCR
jgi:hypothetical protein